MLSSTAVTFPLPALVYYLLLSRLFVVCGLNKLKLYATESLQRSFYSFEGGNRNERAYMETFSVPNPEGLISFAQSAYTFNEHDSTVEITVTRTHGSQGAVEVAYETAPGIGDLSVTVVKAQNLKNMDWWDSSDPLVSVTIGSSKKETSRMQDTLNPKWNERLELGPQARDDLIYFDVYDVDICVSSWCDRRDPLGSVYTSFSSCAKSPLDSACEQKLCGLRGGGCLTVKLEYTAALAGIDYQQTSGRLNFADGETSKTLAIAIIDDDEFEPLHEAFSLHLFDVRGGAYLAQPFSASIDIQDNEKLQPITDVLVSGNCKLYEQRGDYSCLYKNLNEGNRGEASYLWLKRGTPAYTLSVRVVRAHNLRDEDWWPAKGSDPYVAIEAIDPLDRNIKRETSSIGNSHNPAWNELITFGSIKLNQQLRFRIYDEDLVYDDALSGKALLQIGAANSGAICSPSPLGVEVWCKHTLKMPSSGGATLEVEVLVQKAEPVNGLQVRKSGNPIGFQKLSRNLNEGARPGYWDNRIAQAIHGAFEDSIPLYVYIKRGRENFLTNIVATKEFEDTKEYAGKEFTSVKGDCNMGTASEWSIFLWVQRNRVGPWGVYRSLAHKTDDAIERLESGKVISIDSNWAGHKYIELTGSPESLIALRFSSVSVPKDAILLRSWIRFDSEGESDSKYAGADIYMAAVGDLLPFSTEKQSISNLPLTSQSVRWELSKWYKHVYYDTPDLTMIVSEAIAHAEWSQDHPLGVVIKVDGSGKRWAQSFESYQNRAPRLFVEYCDPSTGRLSMQLPTLYPSPRFLRVLCLLSFSSFTIFFLPFLTCVIASSTSLCQRGVAHQAPPPGFASSDHCHLL